MESVIESDSASVCSLLGVTLSSIVKASASFLFLLAVWSTSSEIERVSVIVITLIGVTISVKVIDSSKHFVILGIISSANDIDSERFSILFAV